MTAARSALTVDKYPVNTSKVRVDDSDADPPRSHPHAESHCLDGGFLRSGEDLSASATRAIAPERGADSDSAVAFSAASGPDVFDERGDVSGASAAIRLSGGAGGSGHGGAGVRFYFRDRRPVELCVAACVGVQRLRH